MYTNREDRDRDKEYAKEKSGGEAAVKREFSSSRLLRASLREDLPESFVARAPRSFVAREPQFVCRSWASSPFVHRITLPSP